MSSIAQRTIEDNRSTLGETIGDNRFTMGNAIEDNRFTMAIARSILRGEPLFDGWNRCT